MKKKWAGAWRLVGLAAVGLTAWELLAGSAEVAQSVRHSLALCGGVLIPSLFPFMVLAGLLPATGGIFSALLMGCVGGYPAGARVLANQVDSGQLTPENAGRALCVCVYSSPAFVVTVVGGGLFHSPLLGLQLFGCQLAAGLLTGFLVLGRRWIGPLPTGTPQTEAKMLFSDSLVAAVGGAAAAMVSICAFVLVMAAAGVVLARLGLSGWLAAAFRWLSFGWLTPAAAELLVAGGLEICGGCGLAAGLAPWEAFLVLPFLLSFGGVAVIFQVLAMVGGRGIPLKRFVLSRLVHGVLTQLLARLLLGRQAVATAGVTLGQPALYADPAALPGAALLLGLCGLLCLTVEDGKNL